MTNSNRGCESKGKRIVSKQKKYIVALVTLWPSDL